MTGTARRRHSALPAQLLVLSSDARITLDDKAEDHLKRLVGGEYPDLAELCRLSAGKTRHGDHRLAVLFHTREDLIDRLDAFLGDEDRAGLSYGQAPGSPGSAVFSFSGFGSQWAGMGRDLLTREPVYRQVIDQCDELIRKHIPWSLTEYLETSDDDAPDAATTQLAIFAVQAALVTLWRAWGLAPGAVVGHSLGEVAAALAAGALSLEEAIALVYHRSRLLQRIAGMGQMVAVSAPYSQVLEALKGYEAHVSVAAVNGARTVVIAGTPDGLEPVLAVLRAQGVLCRLLNVGGAGHSPQVDAIRAELENIMGDLKPKRTLIPFYSSITGQPAAGTDLNAAYWGRNLRDPVLFSQTLATLFAAGHRTFVEIGPSPALSVSILEEMNRLGYNGTVLPSLRRNSDGATTMLTAMGKLFALGQIARPISS